MTMQITDYALANKSANWRKRKKEWRRRYAPRYGKHGGRNGSNKAMEWARKRGQAPLLRSHHPLITWGCQVLAPQHIAVIIGV